MPLKILNPKLVQAALRKQADPKAAAFAARFFKTGPGQYGYGDKFLGLTVPKIRQLAKSVQALPLSGIATLLASPWHEERLLGVILLAERGKAASKLGDTTQTKRLADFYWRQRKGINNWDLVDVSAEHVLGPRYFKRSTAPLLKMARSPRLWDRRYAVLATFYSIRRQIFAPTLTLCAKLLDDPQDLMHKACGWMLREVGKRDLSVLRGFLKRHAKRMPRTMLRYAIEKMGPAERAKWMDKTQLF